MMREGIGEEKPIVSDPTPSFPPSHPPQLTPRLPGFASLLNSSPSDEARRQGRVQISSFLKDSAVRSISSTFSENGRPMDIAVEDGAKLVLDELMNEFITDVALEACEFAKRRKTNFVTDRDLRMVLSKRYGVNVPGGGTGPMLQVSGSTYGGEHMKRMAAIRKLNYQANPPSYR